MRCAFRSSLAMSGTERPIARRRSTRAWAGVSPRALRYAWIGRGRDMSERRSGRPSRVRRCRVRRNGCYGRHRQCVRRQCVPDDGSRPHMVGPGLRDRRRGPTILGPPGADLTAHPATARRRRHRRLPAGQSAQRVTANRPTLPPPPGVDTESQGAEAARAPDRAKAWHGTSEEPSYNAILVARDPDQPRVGM